MINKLTYLALTVGIMISTNLTYQGKVIAQESPRLDTESKKIITARVCKMYSTKKYTKRELWNYTWDLVRDNSRLYSETSEASDLLTDTYVEFDRILINAEVNQILKTVSRKCQ